MGTSSTHNQFEKVRSEKRSIQIQAKTSSRIEKGTWLIKIQMLRVDKDTCMVFRNSIPSNIVR